MKCSLKGVLLKRARTTPGQYIAQQPGVALSGPSQLIRSKQCVRRRDARPPGSTPSPKHCMW